jgi:hypothetical protein
MPATQFDGRGREGPPCRGGSRLESNGGELWQGYTRCHDVVLISDYYHIWTYNPRFYSLRRYDVVRISNRVSYR